MKQLIRAASVCLVVLGFLLSFTAMAQVQTAKTNVAVSVKCKGYYEYLPEGYDPNGATTYPMLVFLTGIGEFGDGSATQLPRVLKNGTPKLIDAGTFPTSFTAGGQTHKLIVITPQFTSTPVSASDVEAVLSYMIAHYKVNTNRVYLTGLSYGGGLCFAYTGNSNTNYRARIAGIVPVASPLPTGGYDTIYARSRIIAAGNIPVWATHNSGDTPDSASRTIAYINDINQAPAPNPLAKDTIFNVGGHDAWSKTYDTTFRQNGYNIYEWMLLHQKGSTPPAPNAAPTANAGADKIVTLPTNSITLTGTGTDADGSIVAYRWMKVTGPFEGTITSPEAATTTITGLVRGIYIFRLMVSDNVSAKGVDDVKVTVNPAAGTKAIQVNVYGGTNGYSNTTWNNWNVGTGAGTNITSTSFKYVDGTVSPVTATLGATTAIKDNGSAYATGVSIAPASVMRYVSQHTALRTLTLQGLSATKTYNLEFYASFNSTLTNNNTIFTINGSSVTIIVNGNVNSKAAFTNIAPDASGQIVVSIDKTTTYNYLNGFTISENAGTPPPPPAIRYVKTNLYGGTNPYNNAEWNNWNVSASKTISALKYSDATVSAITAALTSNVTTAVADNGSAYGGTMAPPEVLRYAGYSSLAKTLTFSGLSASSTYSLELYASRGNTGNSTIFTINGNPVTIVTDNNKTNKAVFNNLAANASGQIVVTIDKTATYSYLNGFVLTENNPGGTPSTKASGHTLTPVPEKQESGATAIGAYPNPVSSSVVVRLNNNYNGSVQVQIKDALGRARKELRFVKTGAMLQQTLQLADLSRGVYFITVQMGTQRQTLRISKL